MDTSTNRAVIKTCESRMGPVLRVVRRGGPGARPLLHPSRGTSLGRGGAIQPSPAPSPLSFSVTDVSIPAYIEYHGTIFYQVHVFAGGNNEWMISHRYSDFYALYEKVSYWLPFSTTATFPKKKTFSWILSSTEEDLRERIICLKAWLKEIVAICNQTIGFPGLVFKDLNRIRESVNEFLDVSHHITQSFHDQPNVAVYTEAVPSAPVYAEAHVVSHDPVASPYEPVVVKPSNVSVYNGYP